MTTECKILLIVATKLKMIIIKNTIIFLPDGTYMHKINFPTLKNTIQSHINAYQKINMKITM